MDVEITTNLTFWVLSEEAQINQCFLKHKTVSFNEKSALKK